MPVIDLSTEKVVRYAPATLQEGIVYNRSMRSLLCNQSQIKLSVSQDLLPSNRQRYRSKVRPNNSAHRAPYIQRLPREAPTHQILRCGNQQDISFSDQQFYLAGAYRCTVIQMPLAGRTIFQVDQTKSPYQILLWNNGQCS